ncbi:hypothetical protein [Deinococcus radiodurans]|jgi:hypothetical protein|uniref:Uncharacterized protein n=1 Tax=Deinococcus radiodurans (strain ATCC 13939 / DSM 20539 / JCM 16871 / CCUG 27074 / LMG 4051 / NBRC 15346 / NCIMB 9279 / VKM B-1422 / R1) TaxID=243230 RepID=Q9RWP4_DEIRA|nr:hypothetical protein [Deinococcus radiodurans]AAF10208.1 hypothetical protein DR_0622 [Deinococcus radiodurans R1 = ATCC 13939 = DSM 20539]ANC72141.1 hypothetical protein A2G07_10375 [Deinococcus radiodurans R1 = ATCC 13939 = DSM 20539]QEM72566.1 hypothetical protein DXG80_12855 [Deinococcus radiodurans]QIP32508.1 hypothetical protein HAV35_10765 [Deinococcus radiodurans]UDK99799.1 hypothetical protein E5E91_03245 [Deinococcus radiodurans R1 = ATCC 13939 = DSM 20539]
MSPRALPGLVACLFAGSLSAACAQSGDRPLFVQPPQMQGAPATPAASTPMWTPPAQAAPAQPAPVRPAAAAPVRPLPAQAAPVSPASVPLTPGVRPGASSRPGVTPRALPASGPRPAATATQAQTAAPLKLQLMPVWTGQFMVRPRELAPFNPLGLPQGAVSLR